MFDTMSEVLDNFILKVIFEHQSIGKKYLKVVSPANAVTISTLNMLIDIELTHRKLGETLKC